MEKDLVLKRRRRRRWRWRWRRRTSTRMRWGGSRRRIRFKNEGSSLRSKEKNLIKEVFQNDDRIVCDGEEH